MIRLQNKTARFEFGYRSALPLVAVFLGSLFFTACTSPSQSASTIPTDPNLNPTSGSPLPTTPGTTGTVGTTSGSNLFDTSTSQDAAPTTSATSVSLNGQNTSCLSSTTSGLGVYTGDGSTGSQGYACLGTAQTGATTSLSAQSFYNAGVQNYGYMSSCYQYVAQYAAQYVNSGQTYTQAQVHAIFVSAELALLRCFRNINRVNTNYAPWSQSQMTNYQNTDYYMYLMLHHLGQG